MKKDIPQLKVEDLAIAIVPSQEDASVWDTYIINLKVEPIHNVLISSSGYGEIDGEKRNTATARYFLERIDALDLHLIEPIQEELFVLTNEYWVSFQYDGQMYDRRFMFVPGSLHEINFMRIPFLEREGVMMR
jgi:hypothetical protein